MSKEFSRIYSNSSVIRFCLWLFLAAILTSFGGGEGGDGTSATTEIKLSGVNEASTCNVINISSAIEPLFSYIWLIKNTDRPTPTAAQKLKNLTG